ncbi:MAG: hypothetical protein JXR65_06540 [Bacteroidales bacterium]|nr:hypothetical protein [Bacteroidales bacterium]
MKKILFLILLLTAITFHPGCKVLNKLTQFYMSYDSRISVPATLGVNTPFNIPTPTITTNSESTFAVNNTHKNLIDIINLTELALTITDPSTQTFDFLKDIEIYMSAGDLPEIMIASLYDIPKEGLNRIDLKTVTDNLKDYIIQDSINLRAKVTTRQLVANNTEIAVHCRFWVDAKILGI